MAAKEPKSKMAKKAKKTTLKAVKQALPTSPETNLKKLARSIIPMNFVKKHNGKWDHALWLEFLEELKEKGYYPIDEDQVGLILETKKTAYFEKNK